MLGSASFRPWSFLAGRTSFELASAIRSCSKKIVACLISLSRRSRSTRRELQTLCAPKAFLVSCPPGVFPFPDVFEILRAIAASMKVITGLCLTAVNRVCALRGTNETERGWRTAGRVAQPFLAAVSLTFWSAGFDRPRVYERKKPRRLESTAIRQPGMAALRRLATQSTHRASMFNVDVTR